MKKLIYFTLGVVFLTACQSDENITPETSIVGYWELVEVRSGWTGEVTPVAELPFSDSYELRADGTFAKFNTHFGKELTGTYVEEFPEQDPQSDVLKVLILSFDQEILEDVLERDEAGNLIFWHSDPSYFIVYGQNEREVLSFRNDGSILNSGYGIADGPVNIYHRK
jgi:hypothetical protein